MAEISSRVGVPSTLMISTSWSTPESPGKRGWPRRSSAPTHPVWVDVCFGIVYYIVGEWMDGC